jgi:hypothetical protein
VDGRRLRLRLLFFDLWRAETFLAATFFLAGFGLGREAGADGVVAG